MGLSAWEQQALDSIKDRLAGSDPKLAALLSTFTQAASGEEMPVREKIRAGWRRTTRPSRRQRRHPRRDRMRLHTRRVYQRLGFGQIALLLWLVISAALLGVALALSHSGSQSTCTNVFSAVCADPAATHSVRPAAPDTGASQVPPAAG